MSWSSFVGPPEEPTADTLTAHERVRAFAEAQLSGDESGFAVATEGAEMRVHARGYVVVVRGQSSFTAHGKQGMHPQHLAALRGLPKPVMCLFVETGGHVGYYVWLDRAGEPETHSISQDPSRPRRGWRCEDMTKVVFDAGALERHPGAEVFRFPKAAPAADTPETKGSLF